jgi:hypothetical protein
MGSSTMNQMRTIESFLSVDDGFSLLLKSHYRSIEMELTKIITQITPPGFSIFINNRGDLFEESLTAMDL